MMLIRLGVVLENPYRNPGGLSVFGNVMNGLPENEINVTPLLHRKFGQCTRAHFILEGQNTSLISQQLGTLRPACVR